LFLKVKMIFFNHTEFALSLDVILNPQEEGILVKWRFTKCNFPVVKQLIDFYVIQVCNQRDCKGAYHRD
jgi:hypothetical protein